jgi:hypothetical protein
VAAEAENQPVASRTASPLAPGVRSAALAYSALAPKHADAVSALLSAPERRALSDGVARVEDAPADEREAALQALVDAVNHGIAWPHPKAHNPASCPFLLVADYPRAYMAEILERLAEHRALLVAVTLCHLDGQTRAELWRFMARETRDRIEAKLGDVPSVGAARTQTLASDLRWRLTREREIVEMEASD